MLYFKKLEQKVYFMSTLNYNYVLYYLEPNLVQSLPSQVAQSPQS